MAKKVTKKETPKKREPADETYFGLKNVPKKVRCSVDALIDEIRAVYQHQDRKVGQIVFYGQCFVGARVQRKHEHIFRINTIDIEFPDESLHRFLTRGENPVAVLAIEDFLFFSANYIRTRNVVRCLEAGLLVPPYGDLMYDLALIMLVCENKPDLKTELYNTYLDTSPDASIYQTLDNYVRPLISARDPVYPQDQLKTLADSVKDYRPGTVFEIALNGNDLENSETDELVKWVRMQDNIAVQTWLADVGLLDHVKKIRELSDSAETGFEDGVDVIVHRKDDSWQIETLYDLPIEDLVTGWKAQVAKFEPKTLTPEPSAAEKLTEVMTGDPVVRPIEDSPGAEHDKIVEDSRDRASL